MRIALVSREYPPFFGGGIGTYARNIAPALAAAGCDVHVITQAYDETHPRVECNGRLTVHRAPLAGDPAGWTAAVMRFSAFAGRLVADLAARGEIDVAEFAECEGAGAVTTLLEAAACGARRSKPIPTVVHLHTPTEQLFALRSIFDKAVSPPLAAYFLAERASMLSADLLCAPSAFIADWAQRHYELAERPIVIPYAIDRLPDMPPPPATKRVLYVGRIEPRKGVEPLILAWMRIAAQRPGWTLRLIGADTSTSDLGRSFRGRLQSLLTPQAAGTVEFVDALPPAMLAREYAQAAVCVVPSLWENFPNTCIESMSFARPVVASDEGGMAEMIGQTEAGVVFRSGDPDDLARVMSALLAEPAEALRRRGETGRKRIGEMCDHERVVQARLRLYETAIERAAARQSLLPAAREARLTLWRRMQSAAAGRLEGLGLPALSPRLARWLPEAERAAMEAAA